MTKGKISRVGGIHPPCWIRSRNSSGGQDPAQGSVDVEFMTAGIEGRVGQHRDAVEDDAVEQVRAADIAPPAPLLGLTLLVVEEEGAVLVGVGHRHDRLVGADHRAHAAADAGVGDRRLLADTGKGAVFAAPLGAQDVEPGHPLAHVGEADGILGTDRGAVAAEGATILAMLDDPGKIGGGQAAWGNGYGSC